MSLLRIRQVEPLDGHRVRLTLTNGTVVDRDLAPLLRGPMFELVKKDPECFRAVRVEAGGLAWKNGADLCPDTVIWAGAPPEDESRTPPRTSSPP